MTANGRKRDIKWTPDGWLTCSLTLIMRELDDSVHQKLARYLLLDVYMNTEILGVAQVVGFMEHDTLPTR